MDAVEKRLYGHYPRPYAQHEYELSYNYRPRAGPDNIDLVMMGWQGKESRNVLPVPKGPIPQRNSPAPYSAPPQVYAQNAQLPHRPSNAAPPYGVDPQAQQHGRAGPGPGAAGGGGGGPPPSAANGMPHSARGAPNGYAGPGSQGGAGGPGAGPTAHYHMYQAQAAPAAGNYRHGVFDPIGMPRSGRGVYADSALHDNLQVMDQGLSTRPEVREADMPTRAKPKGEVQAHAHQDSLEAFMTGLGPNPAMDDRPPRPREYAGKSTESHIEAVPTGLIGPQRGPLDDMPHMRHFGQGAHASNLVPHPQGGYIAAEPQNGRGGAPTFSGLRMFPGVPQTQAHIQVSATGLTTDSAPQRVRPLAAQANFSNIAFSAGGLSHYAKDGGYPATNHTAHAGKGASHLVHKDAGIVQSGDDPAKRRPFAGKANQSHLVPGQGGIGGDGVGARGPWQNPHAGKGQASQITYSSGTMTVIPHVAGPQLRKPAASDPHWATTYDTSFMPDTYTKVALKHNEVVAAQAAQWPQRF